MAKSAGHTPEGVQRIEEVIGESIDRRRRELGLSMTGMAARIGETFGMKPWSASLMTTAVNGGRAIPAAELVAWAVALETSIVDLLTPEHPSTPVPMEYRGPGEQTVDAVDAVTFEDLLDPTTAKVRKTRAKALKQRIENEAAAQGLSVTIEVEGQ